VILVIFQFIGNRVTLLLKYTVYHKRNRYLIHPNLLEMLIDFKIRCRWKEN